MPTQTQRNNLNLLKTAPHFSPNLPSVALGECALRACLHRFGSVETMRCLPDAKPNPWNAFFTSLANQLALPSLHDSCPLFLAAFLFRVGGCFALWHHNLCLGKRRFVAFWLAHQLRSGQRNPAGKSRLAEAKKLCPL